MNKLIVCLLTSSLLFSALAHAGVTERVDESIYALDDLMAANETSIPVDLMRAAKCIVNIHVIQAGFIFGGKGGGGLASCKTKEGKWGAPVFINLGGGSWGLQIGIESVDLTLVFTTKDARQRLTGGNFTLGGNVGLTAGPEGRNASAGTNWTLEDRVFSYSRSKGLYAGLTLEGSYLFLDSDLMQQVYPGKRAREVLELTGSDISNLVNDYTDTLEKYTK